MSHSGDHARERGFTLIEVMIAILILTLELLTLAQMTILATHAKTLSGRMTSSSTLAKERFRVAPFEIDPVTRDRNPALRRRGE